MVPRLLSSNYDMPTNKPFCNGLRLMLLICKQENSGEGDNMSKLGLEIGNPSTSCRYGGPYYGVGMEPYSPSLGRFKGS